MEVKTITIFQRSKMKPDLVYVLKNSTENEEFRYSLRSVEKHAKNCGKVMETDLGFKHNIFFKGIPVQLKDSPLDYK